MGVCSPGNDAGASVAGPVACRTTQLSRHAVPNDTYVKLDALTSSLPTVVLDIGFVLQNVATGDFAVVNMEGPIPASRTLPLTTDAINFALAAREHELRRIWG